MNFRVRWIDTYLHLVMGIFYLLILTNILNRNYIKLNMCIITQIIPASHKRLFLLRISHISVLFLVLLVPNISVHLFVFRWTCFLFFFFLFFFSFFFFFLFAVALHSWSISAFTSTHAHAHAFGHNPCQRLPLIHLNIQYRSKHIYIYTQILQIEYC